LTARNSVGEGSRVSGGNGIFIHNDLANGKPNPVGLDSNIVRSDKLNGILIADGAGKGSGGGVGASLLASSEQGLRLTLPDSSTLFNGTIFTQGHAYTVIA
jgi:hypothetical protein